MFSQSVCLPGPEPASGDLKAKQIGIHEALEILRNKSSPENSLFTEVLKLVKVICLIPSTNAVSERSFSAMKLIKSNIHASTTDNRLNNLLVLYIQKDLTDNINLKLVAEEYVNSNSSRRTMFGTFI